MSGTYRVPNKRPDERADAPFKFVFYPPKPRDVEQGRLWYLTARQRSEIRAALRVVIEDTRQYRSGLVADRNFTREVYAIADRYGVPVPVILRVWRGREKLTRR